MIKNQVANAGMADEKLPANENTAGLWSVNDLMRRVPLCRRSIHNLRKKGLPSIVLGRRLFFHPPSVESWLMRQQRGGEQ
jgi:hypothetical protein